MDETERIVTDTIVSMFKNRKKKVSRSPTKLPPAENSNFLKKPKNDDSSETSSMKDSGYEELDNDRLKSRRREKRSDQESSPVKTRAEEQQSRKSSPRKTGKKEAVSVTGDSQEHSPPVFNLKDINSIWADDDEDEEDVEKDKNNVEPIRNESDVDYLNDDQLSSLSPLSSRTTILD